jgi:hypothetical protein
MTLAGWLLLGGPAAFFAWMGLLGLVRPRAIPALFGGAAPTPESRTEVRAVYGGFGLGVAATLVACGLFPGAEARGALAACSAGVGAMALGRIAGALLERRQRASPTWVLVAVELALAASLLAAASQMPRS